jgi:hypothetical protein
MTKQLTTVGTSKYVARITKILSSLKADATPDEWVEQGILLQIELSNIVQEIWNRAYEVGYTDGKKIGIFEDKKN